LDDAENHIQNEMRASDIQPWAAMPLVQQRLDVVAHLASNLSLQNMDVENALKYFAGKLKRGTHERKMSEERSLDKLRFSRILTGLLDSEKVYPVWYNYDEDVSSVSDSIAGLGECDILSVGQWAFGLVLFVQGTQEEKAAALFQLLDEDGDGFLSMEDLKEYLKLLVQAMTPSEYQKQLLPHLLHFCAGQIMLSMSKSGDGKVSEQKFIEWLSSNSLIDTLVQLVEAIVYRSFLRRQADDALSVVPVNESNRSIDQIRSNLLSAEIEAMVRQDEDHSLFVAPKQDGSSKIPSTPKRRYETNRSSSSVSSDQSTTFLSAEAEANAYRNFLKNKQPSLDAEDFVLAVSMDESSISDPAKRRSNFRSTSSSSSSSTSSNGNFPQEVLQEGSWRGPGFLSATIEVSYDQKSSFRGSASTADLQTLMKAGVTEKISTRSQSQIHDSFWA